MLLLYTNKLIHLSDTGGRGALIYLIFTIQVLLVKNIEYFNLLNDFKIKKIG